MSNRPKRRPSRSQALAKASSSRQSRLTWIIVVVVVLVLGAGLVAILVSSSDNSEPTSDATPSEIVAKVTSVDENTTTDIGRGAAQSLPTAIDAPPLTADDKPLVFYAGAEYCPFCAAQRWAMVMALSRFGTFGDLTLSHSAGNDVFPNTATFSFYESTYDSDYIAFTGLETQDRDHNPLQTPTADQQQLLATYNTAGSIPFIDFGGSYVFSGAIYSPEVLQGKTHDEIADALSDPSNAIAQSIAGSANVFTATICLLTDNQPDNVCGNPTIGDLQQQIEAG